MTYPSIPYIPRNTGVDWNRRDNAFHSERCKERIERHVHNLHNQTNTSDQIVCIDHEASYHFGGTSEWPSDERQKIFHDTCRKKDLRITCYHNNKHTTVCHASYEVIHEAHVYSLHNSTRTSYCYNGAPHGASFHSFHSSTRPEDASQRISLDTWNMSFVRRGLFGSPNSSFLVYF